MKRRRHERYNLVAGRLSTVEAAPTARGPVFYGYAAQLDPKQQETVPTLHFAWLRGKEKKEDRPHPLKSSRVTSLTLSSRQVFVFFFSQVIT